MVGTAPHGQLMPSARPAAARVRYELATPADDAALRQLLRATPMRGAITLSFEREPDYFRGANLAGAEDHTILAYEADRLVCAGRCTTRLAWLNGHVHRAGYLGELRLAEAARGRFEILRRGYQFFHALHQARPAEFYFTSIAADNGRARRLLERGFPGWPRYSFLAELTTLVIPLAALAAGSLPRGDHASPEEMAEFLNREGRGSNLANHWSAENLLSLSAHGLPVERLHSIRDPQGRIQACAGLWDQRSFRQTVVRGYSGPLAWARPVLNLFGPLLGRPRLPEPDSVVRHAFASPLFIAPGAETVLPTLLRLLARDAASTDLEYLTLAFSSSHPLLAIARHTFPARAYHSRLYRVSWPGGVPFGLDARPLHPEAAFL